MKNRHTAALVLITCVFVSFTLGFLLGRTTGHSDVQISRLAEVTEPTPAPVSTEARTLPLSTAPAVPEETAAPTQMPTQAPTQVPGLININTATQAQLETLPGIGPVLAQRILAYREENGPFTAISQLTLVSGIGEKKLAALIDLITVE